MRYLFARSHRTPSSRPNGVEEDQATLTGTVGFGKKNFQQLFIDMKHKLPSVSERLFTKGRAKQRAAIAALSMGGIDNRTIAVFMETTQKQFTGGYAGLKRGNLSPISSAVADLAGFLKPHGLRPSLFIVSIPHRFPEFICGHCVMHRGISKNTLRQWMVA